MDHDVPLVSVNIDRDLLVGKFPQQTFIVLSIFRFVYSESEIVAAEGRETFFALVSIVSRMVVVCHKRFLMIC